MPRDTSSAQGSQEAQYSFPYHYLPRITNDGFSQFQHWSWGYRYLGRLKVVFDLLAKIEFQSLLDIGCGDGRFLSETLELYNDRKLAGIDTSAKAITLAKQFNPGLELEQRDILVSPLNSRWDVITLLEVIEHIPRESLPDFMRAVGKMLRPGGTLIITVPHLNEKLIKKHYQHFDAENLIASIPAEFDDCSCVFFDHISPLMRVFLKLMGGSGKFYVISHQGLNNLLYKHYTRHCLYGDREETCKRIALMARKTKPSLTQPTPGVK